ncbi:MAG: hypothetical protein R3Y05_02780 [bacterium]
MKLFKTIVLFSILIFTLISSLDVFASGSTYKSTFTINLDSEIGESMINQNFESELLVEKISGLNYIFLNSKEENTISKFSFFLDNALVGSQSIDNKTIMFVLSDANLYKEIQVEAYVSAMSSKVEFNFKVNELQFVSNDILQLEDRVAQFIPMFSIESYDFGTQLQGSVVKVPEITAKLNNSSCEVSINAYYEVGSELREVELLGSNLTLSNSGNYYVVYKSSSDKYLTYNNELTSNTLEIKIFVMSDGGLSYSVLTNVDKSIELGDYNAIFTSFTQLKTQQITDGEDYNNVTGLLSKISNNFKMYDIDVVDSLNNTIPYNSKVLLSIKIDGTYDRSKTEVYYYNENKIIKVNSDILVNKVVLDTHLMGTFIVVEENVNPINIPMLLMTIFIVFFIISILGLGTTTINSLFNKKEKKI